MTKEQREFLAKTFKVTEHYVYMCLYYRKNAGKAEKIRHTALQRGGVPMATVVELETLHDADGYMRQYFPNGAMLECNKETGRVDVVHRGKRVNSFTGVTISQLTAIQTYAKKL